MADKCCQLHGVSIVLEHLISFCRNFYCSIFSYYYFVNVEKGVVVVHRGR